MATPYEALTEAEKRSPCRECGCPRGCHHGYHGEPSYCHNGPMDCSCDEFKPVCPDCDGREVCEMCDGNGTVEHHSGSGVINCPNGYDDSGGRLYFVGCKPRCKTCGGSGTA